MVCKLRITKWTYNFTPVKSVGQIYLEPWREIRAREIGEGSFGLVAHRSPCRPNAAYHHHSTSSKTDGPGSWNKQKKTANKLPLRDVGKASQGSPPIIGGPH